MSFPLPYLKAEGAPAHPDDILIHCGCAACEARWQKQLAAYHAYHGAADPPSVESGPHANAAASPPTATRIGRPG
jgi:hypothetical protein